MSALKELGIYNIKVCCALSASTRTCLEGGAAPLTRSVYCLERVQRVPGARRQVCAHAGRALCHLSVTHVAQLQTRSLCKPSQLKVACCLQ